MNQTDIETYKKIIEIFESALIDCKDYSEQEYYIEHIERFNKKIKELE
jgi:hypothetical protein